MADTVIEWTYAGRTFGITLDPADIDEALSMITRVGDDDDFSLGLARMIERGQHASEDFGIKLENVTLNMLGRAKRV